MNLFFLSGPQGGGKTTLANLLGGPNIFVPKLETKTMSLDVNPRQRLALKICQRSLENFEYLKIARENPDKIVVGNRCIYDQYAFNEVYLKRGWIDKETKEKYDELSAMFYLDVLRKPYAIVLNPGFESVKRHLEERWKVKGKKWREDDLEYILLVCETYEAFRTNENIFYIDHEISLNSDSDINEIREWLSNCRKPVYV